MSSFPDSTTVILPAVLDSRGTVATTGAAPPDRIITPPRKSNRNFWFGLLAIVAALGVAVYLVLQSMAEGPANACVYFPGDVAVEAGTRILYIRTDVGSVKSVAKLASMMQLIASSTRNPRVIDVHTVAPATPISSPVNVGGVLWTLDTATRTIGVAWDTHALKIAYNAKLSAWMLLPPGDVPCTIDGIAVSKFDTAAIGKALHSGDVFGFGDATVEWHEPGEMTLATLAIEKKKLRSLVDSGQEFGPGSTIEFVTNLGLTHPTLKINTSFRQPGTVVPPMVELVPITGLDLLAIANKLTSYLFAESKAYAPPTDRFERGVSDLNTTLSSVDALTTQLKTDLGTKAGALPKDATALAAFIVELQKLSADLRPLVPQASGVIADAKNTWVPRILNTVDTTVAHVNVLLDQGRSLLNNLDANTIPSLNSTVASLQPEIRSLIIQLQIVLKNVSEAVRKIRDFVP